MGLVRGFVAPFRGVLFVVRERLWGYLVVPFLLNAGLTIAAFVVAWRYWQGENLLAGHTSVAVGNIILVLLSLVLAAILFVAAQPLLGAIFNDRLSERVERIVRGQVPSVSLPRAVGRAFLHGFLKTILYVLALLIGLFLTAFAGLGGFVGVGLGALFLAYDGFDYPLSRRGAGFGAKWRFLFLHPGLTIGYGLGATIFHLVPLTLFVAPSVAAAGATLAFLDTEKTPEKTPLEKAPQNPNKGTTG